MNDYALDYSPITNAVNNSINTFGALQQQAIDRQEAQRKN